MDTSRFTLRFAVLHMAAYPDIQKKVQAEIDRVVGEHLLANLGIRFIDPGFLCYLSILQHYQTSSSLKTLGQLK